MPIELSPNQERELNCALWPRFDRGIAGGWGHTGFNFHHFRELMTKVTYEYYKERGLSAARGAISSGLRNSLTKYAYFYGHGDSTRVYWGEMEAIMYDTSNVRTAMWMRAEPPIFSEVHTCDSLTRTGGGTWAYELTKGYSPNSCVIGYRGMEIVSADYLTNIMWPSVKQFYDYILRGMSFYAAYRQALTDCAKGGVDASGCFRFAGDESHGFRLPYFNLVASMPVWSYKITTGIDSLSCEINLADMGDTWTLMRFECNREGEYWYREQKMIATEPGQYVLPIENAKGGGTRYSARILVANSYHRDEKSGITITV